jgi:hypothetical protein
MPLFSMEIMEKQGNNPQKMKKKQKTNCLLLDYKMKNGSSGCDILV